MAKQQPHIALMPTAGMGHFIPFLRLASKLLSLNCKVSIITGTPFLTAAEDKYYSSFLSKYPQITHSQYQILPSDNIPGVDPFFLRYGAISKSTHLAFQQLALLPTKCTTLVCDFMMAGTATSLVSHLDLPCYILMTTSFRFFSFMSYLPTLMSQPETLDGTSSSVEIPGLGAFDFTSLPSAFIMPNHYVSKFTVSRALGFKEPTGFLFNSFESFEQETISALNDGKVLSALPPCIPIGPLEDCQVESSDRSLYLDWLDMQERESVVYVNFGNRTAMSSEEIRELGKGLEESGFRFLWVVKTTKIDLEEKEELSNVLGEDFMERVKGKGLILKEWVVQNEILSHQSIGGFFSHCGWNSVMEAAIIGVPVLAWPLHGDQRWNAELVEKAGLGLLERSWGYGLEKFVGSNEIAAMVRKLMTDKDLKSKVMSVKHSAHNAISLEGESHKNILHILIEGNQFGKGISQEYSPHIVTESNSQ